MIKQSIPALVAGSVLAMAAACADAQVLKERIAWNWSSGSQGTQMLALYDAGSTLQSFRTWQYGSAWRLVGAAGNRLLWQEQVNAQNATLWKINDVGDYLSHIVLRPPASGYKARSLNLGSSWIGACYDRDDNDQAYWILWEKDVPGTQIYVQLVRGNGVVALNHLISKPVAMGTRPALALTQIYGNELAVLFPQDSGRASIWLIALGTMRFYLDEWLLVANPILRPTGGETFAPASLNAYWDQGNDGAMVQILFNQTSPTSQQGRALVVNVREMPATPFGRQVIKREIWTHISSNNTAVYATGATQEASAHTIQPDVCP